MRQLRKNIFRVSLITAASLSLFACATSRSMVTANAGYINPKALPIAGAKINKIRLAALRETATSLGARGALAWRSTHINSALTKEVPYLDHIFDFNQVLLSHNVLPPILVQSDGNLTLDNSKTIRSATKTYKIVAPARFVTAPPTWRTYLWMNFKKPEVPNNSLLPTSQVEAFVWDQYLKNGWEQGLVQANDIFSANLSRLKRDYIGMALYRKLLSENMISSPTVSNASLGVTGNDNEMRINDAISRITSDSSLKLNSNKWNPVLTNQ